MFTFLVIIQHPSPLYCPSTNQKTVSVTTDQSEARKRFNRLDLRLTSDTAAVDPWQPVTELNSRSHKQYTLIDTPHTWDENILNVFLFSESHKKLLSLKHISHKDKCGAVLIDGCFIKIFENQSLCGSHFCSYVTAFNIV